MKKRLLCLFLCLLTAWACFPLLTACTDRSNTRYEIAGEYDPDSRTLSARMQLDFFNSSENALSELSFYLLPNAFAEGETPVSELYYNMVYYKGKSYGNLSVTECELPFRSEGYFLRVQLPEALFPDERISFSMKFQTVFPEINHRFGVGERVTSFTDFFPQLCPLGRTGFTEIPYTSVGDPFVRDTADYSLRLTVPCDYPVTAVGIVDAISSGDRTEYAIERKGVRELALFSGDFRTETRSISGIELKYACLGGGDPGERLRLATDCFVYYNRSFGEYPDDEFLIVESDLPFGGMEYSSACVLSSALRGQEAEQVLAYEIAHQWWYYAVGNDSYRNAWMDEGLASFSAALFFDAYPDYGLSGVLVGRAASAYRTYFSVYSQLCGEVDGVMTRPLDGFTGEYEYECIAYHKGTVMFGVLEENLGGGRLLSALKGYYRKYQGKIAAPEDLIACFPRSAEGLFRSFLEGKCVI